jgi:Terminase small subunit
MRAGAVRAEVTVEQVVRELKLLGFSDIRKIVSWRNELVTRTEKGKDGEPVMVLMPRVTIVDADKISDEAAAAVAEVSQTVNGALRVKLHDKHAALVSIGRYLGMFDDKVKVDVVYGISEEPMSAKEWKKQFVKAGVMLEPNRWAWRPQEGPQQALVVRLRSFAVKLSNRLDLCS